ncbi:MAG: hypothetical protein FIA92_13210, partial [Chloroflexi bacterium]|nr:hypothetical protein [Chloroflexota bacterium]
LTRRLEAPWRGDPWPLYRRLRTGDPALFSAILDLDSSPAPGTPRAIVSASPEPILSLDPDGLVAPDPITGARPRGRGRAGARRERSTRDRSRLDRADRRQRAARLGQRLGPFLGRVAAPGDPATDMQADSLAVGDERSNEDARLHAAVGTDPAGGARVRPATNRLEALEDLHGADLGRAGDRAAGEGCRQEVECVATRFEAAGDGADEVLDGGRSFEPAEPRHANAARPADPPEVVAQDVDDHDVLGPILGAAEQLAREAPVVGAAGCP